MGKISREFGELVFSNEAEVSQHFILPLLKDFLGYHSEEIKPEKNYPVSMPIHSGVSEVCTTKNLLQRPDYVICIDGRVESPNFIIDSKGPKENLEKHLGQLRSYAVGIGANTIVISNGSALNIYDVNEPLFIASSIEEIDINFDILKIILSRDNQVLKNLPDIIKEIDFDRSLGKSTEDIAAEGERKLRIQLSDFQSYLESTSRRYSDWDTAAGSFSFINEEIDGLSPAKLLRFSPDITINRTSNNREKFHLWEVLSKFNSEKLLIVGPSGSGKSTLLRFMTFEQAKLCTSLKANHIPIYVQLRYYSKNCSLFDQIISALAEGDLFVSGAELIRYFSESNFLLLLDALDEVNEDSISECIREIVQISENYDHRIIVTTRGIRKHSLPTFTTFYVCPLNKEIIRQFINQCVSSGRDRLLREIGRKELRSEAQNTLILVLLIVLFRKNSTVPVSRFRIISSTMEFVRQWEQEKLRKSHYGLNWEKLVLFLSKLAFSCVRDGNNLSIPITQADEEIILLLDELESNREIPGGTDKRVIYNALELTGFVTRNAGSILFYHRAILEYFAAMEFAKIFSKTPDIMIGLVNLISWERIIISSNHFLDSSNRMIEALSRINVELAAQCLPEVNSIDESYISSLIEILRNMCFSRLRIVRTRALSLLMRIDLEYTRKIYSELVKTNDYIEVRMIALENYARTRTEDAKKLVYEWIDWDEISGFEFGTSQGSIAKALAYFSLDEHLRIIDIWKKNRDIPTGFACREALLTIIELGNLTEELKEAVLDFYLQTNREDYDKRGGLAKIICEFKDESLLPQLLNDLKGRDFMQKSYTADILASYSSVDVINSLFDIALCPSNSIENRHTCAAALKDSKGDVPITYFQQLLEEDDSVIRMYAIEGLDRFETTDIHNILLNNLDIPDDDPESWRVQTQVLKILAERGLLSDILKRKLFPHRIVLDTLVSLIAKYRLREYIPVLHRMLRQEKNPRQKVNIAHALLLLKENEACARVIDQILGMKHSEFTDHFYFVELIALSVDLDTELGLRLIKQILTIIDTLPSENTSFLLRHCIEVLETIKGSDAKAFLKALLELKISSAEHSLDIERVIRAINSMVAIEDEGWYIDFIESNPQLSKIELHRALEGISMIGSDRSIEFLTEYVHKLEGDDYLLNDCIYYIESAYAQRGIRKYLNEDILGL